MVLRILAAVISALLLSASFPPLNLGWLAWFAFIPLLVVPTPRRLIERAFIGYLFGYLHFATSLHWLNEVGFGAGWLLSLVCALFPMAWYLLISQWNWRLKEGEALSRPGAGLIHITNEWKGALSLLAYAVYWVAMEFLRGRLFTGFPWNLAGVSQYQMLPLLKMVPLTGVYGLSFLILLFNAVVALELSRQIGYFLFASKRGFPWYLPLAACVAVPTLCICLRPAPPQQKPIEHLKCLPIQGNLPQCRVWTQTDFQNALDTYSELTRSAIQLHPEADLIIWPECAVPAELNYKDYHDALQRLHAEIQKPFLIGALRAAPTEDGDGENLAEFNSAFHIGIDGKLLGYYDKMYRVPFGEYTPFGDQLPWLREMIGMGRDLTPGRDYHIFSLSQNAKAGVAICYEDVFPISCRKFTLKGANMLITITNDAWYNHSSGAEQHLAHAVFRAVENQRPLLRCGNNSFTCLITPQGKILDVPRDPLDGNPFIKAHPFIHVPVHKYEDVTFFTLHGDFFGRAMLLASIIFLTHAFILTILKHGAGLAAAKRGKAQKK